MTHRNDEGPSVAALGLLGHTQLLDGPKFTAGLTAEQVKRAAKACDGCGKPFNALRKPRGVGTAAFIGFEPSPEGAALGFAPPSVLCGACRDALRATEPPSALPAGLRKQFEDAEALFFATASGGAQ